MTIRFFLLFIFCNLAAYADVKVEEVTGQFLNVHGADWSQITNSENDWQEVRYWHEKIIEDPSTVEQVYPQPGMPEYIQPIAIHSYGKLIGEYKIPLDEKSKELLNKLAIEIPSGENNHSASTLEAIALTNSPWGVQTLRGLIGDDPKLNHQIFNQLANITERFNHSPTQYDQVDTDYKVSKIDYQGNEEDWNKEIYEIRKLATTYIKNNPNFKQNKIFSKLSKNSNMANKVLNESRLNNSAGKVIKSVMINTNIGDRPTGKKTSILHPKNNSVKYGRKIAMVKGANQNENQIKTFWPVILIVLLVLITLGIVFYRTKKN